MTFQWRTLSDGRVETEQQGILRIDPGHDSLKRVMRFWPLIQKHAGRTGVPASWIVGFINAESAGVPDGPPSSAKAIGLMQLIPELWRGHTQAEMQEPDRNIEYGADLLASKIVRHKSRDLPLMASSYICGTPFPRPDLPWGLCEDPGHPQYISRVVAGNNSFVERYGNPQASSDAWPWLVGFGLLLGGAWYIRKQ